LEVKIPRFSIDSNELPQSLPVFPLQGALLLPGGILPLNIFEPRYVQMVKDTIATSHRMIVMTLPSSNENNGSDVYKLACAGKLISFEETLDGRFLISLSGIIRCRLNEDLEEKGGYKRMAVDFSEFLDDMKPNNIKIERNGFFETLRTYFDIKGLSADWKAIEKCEDEKLITTLAMLCPFSDAEKQSLLEANCLTDRASLMKVILEMSVFGENNQNVRKH
jgi:Lon protease-like protein